MACRHYLNQCWNIVNWTIGIKLQWTLNRHLFTFIQENAFENVVCEIAGIDRGLTPVAMMWPTTAPGTNRAQFPFFHDHFGSEQLKAVNYAEAKAELFQLFFDVTSFNSSMRPSLDSTSLYMHDDVTMVDEWQGAIFNTFTGGCAPPCAAFKRWRHGNRTPLLAEKRILQTTHAWSWLNFFTNMG